MAKIKVTLEIEYDENEYAAAYGMSPEDVTEDATTHLTAVARVAADYAISGLGVDASILEAV